MQFPLARRFLFQPVALLFVAGSCSLALPQALLAQPDIGGVMANPVGSLAEEGPAWTALIALRDRLKDADAEETVKANNALFTAHPEMNPIVANVLMADVAALHSDKLGQPDKALEIYDWALNKYKAQDGSISTLEGKGRLLLDSGKAGEAEALMESRWPQVIALLHVTHSHLRSMASRCVQIRFQALQKQKQPAEALELLTSTLSEAPALLDPSYQVASDWSSGWLYPALVDGLIESKQFESAAGWARLGFAQSNFDKDAIERATSVVGRIWAAQDDFVSARAFGAAQSDAARPNPLSKVSLPVLSTPLLESELKRLQEAQAKGYDRERVPQVVTMLIGLGRYRPAMVEARGLLSKFPTAPEGVQQVARVFKAADLSLVRANQFIAYLDGKGENPLPAFMQEPDAPVGAPAKPVVQAKPVVKPAQSALGTSAPATKTP